MSILKMFIFLSGGMKLIERTYLQELISLMNTPDIKIITWVRRCWKSKLLRAFEKYILENIPNANVITINFNLLEFQDLQEYHALNDYVENRYIPWVQNFLLVDEVQMCKGFEYTINNLYELEKYQIYLTWSNAFLLGSGLVTLFLWRFIEIKVFPFSFQEYMKYYESKDIDKAFDSFLVEWWLAWTYPIPQENSKRAYLLDVYNTLILRDIETKYNIRYTNLMDRLNDFLMDNIWNIVSTRGIEHELGSKWYKVTHITISKYLKYLCDAFLYYRVRRYDIKGKKYLSYQDKFYLSDLGFKYSKIWKKVLNYWRAYENLVAIELLRRWYELYVWVLYEKEIDFVAIKQDEKLYIQVSSSIDEESTFEREVAPLLKIKDANPKLLIARTKHGEQSYEGIKVIDIARWLTEKD